jgi:hypothetical protein
LNVLALGITHPSHIGLIPLVQPTLKGGAGGDRGSLAAINPGNTDVMKANLMRLLADHIGINIW